MWIKIVVTIWVTFENYVVQTWFPALSIYTDQHKWRQMVQRELYTIYPLPDLIKIGFSVLELFHLYGQLGGVI